MPTNIQIELSDNLNKKVEFYKTEHGLKTKEEAILKMIKEIPFKVQIEGLPRVKKNGGKL